MRARAVTLPEIGFIVGTRAALGMGVGLLLSERLSRSQRRLVGGILVGIGILTTIPAAMIVLDESRLLPDEEKSSD